ncbi:hypothetical protein NMD79_07245 [Edwardsiella tarda]
MSRCPSLPSALLLILIPLTGTTQTLSLDGAWRTHDANPPFDTLAPCPRRQAPGGRCAYRPTGIARAWITKAHSGISASLPYPPWPPIAWRR